MGEADAPLPYKTAAALLGRGVYFPKKHFDL